MLRGLHKAACRHKSLNCCINKQPRAWDTNCSGDLEGEKKNLETLSASRALVFGEYWEIVEKISKTKERRLVDKEKLHRHILHFNQLYMSIDRLTALHI